MNPKVPPRPATLRVIVFIDGQNFYNDCKRTFGKGETYPHLLGQELCGPKFGNDRQLRQVRFYTGIHTPDKKPKMHAYMIRRLEMMEATGVWTFARPLKYNLEWIRIEGKDDIQDDTPKFIEVMKGREKGVDVRLALDLVRLGNEDKYDVASVVSTDTDLDEAVRDVIGLRETTERWLAVENAVCVCPVDPITGRRPPHKKLRSAGRVLHIDQNLFEKIRDDTDYFIEEAEEDNDGQENE